MSHFKLNLLAVMIIEAVLCRPTEEEAQKCINDKKCDDDLRCRATCMFSAEDILKNIGKLGKCDSECGKLEAAEKEKCFVKCFGPDAIKQEDDKNKKTESDKATDDSSKPKAAEEKKPSTPEKPAFAPRTIVNLNDSSACHIYFSSSVVFTAIVVSSFLN